MKTLNFRKVLRKLQRWIGIHWRPFVEVVVFVTLNALGGNTLFDHRNLLEFNGPIINQGIIIPFVGGCLWGGMTSFFFLDEYRLKSMRMRIGLRLGYGWRGLALFLFLLAYVCGLVFGNIQLQLIFIVYAAAWAYPAFACHVIFLVRRRKINKVFEKINLSTHAYAE